MMRTSPRQKQRNAKMVFGRAMALLIAVTATHGLVIPIPQQQQRPGTAPMPAPRKAPSIQSPSSPAAPAKPTTTSTARVRIRTAEQTDLSDVAELLTDSLIPSAPSDRYNFKLAVERLQTKSAVESLLASRFRTIRHGQQFWKDYAPVLPELSHHDGLRLLWSNDAFRVTLETAARRSTEPHPWNRHNFAIVPESADWLRHQMITATANGEVIGFCEIAMLEVPGNDDDDDDDDDDNGETKYAPTIVNLVTSSNYRRRGVASALLGSASRLVQRSWSAQSLRLYVEEENHSAQKLYDKLGFETVSRVQRKSRHQLYMVKQ